MSDKKPVPDPAPTPTRSCFAVRCLRAVRKSLEDDGRIGRITAGRAYATLTDARQLCLVAQPALWALEACTARYTMDELDWLLRTQFGEPGHHYGAVGRFLVAPATECFVLLLWLWFALDFGLGLLYRVLDWVTVEPHEVARREYDEARRRLGDVDAGDGDGRAASYLAPVVDHDVFWYVQLAVVAWCVWTFASDVGGAVYQVLQEEAEQSTFQIGTVADLARLNPYRRDLPGNQENGLREGEADGACCPLILGSTFKASADQESFAWAIVVYINHVLRDLIPTSVPEDDYQLFSTLLRSLEVRTDLSWRIFEETEIRTTIQSAASRGGYMRNPIADEPFALDDRLKALHRHWDELALAPGKPERWEDASDTTFMVPVLQGRALNADQPSMHEGKGDGLKTTLLLELEEVAPQKAEPEGVPGHFDLGLTPEQDAEATRVYRRWRKRRDRAASYLRDHPPAPMAWAPRPTTQAGVQRAWDDIHALNPGGSADVEQWKPLYRSLMLERVPFGWTAPDEPEPDAVGEELDALSKQLAREGERRARQREYQLELKRGLEAAEEGRREL